MLRQSIPPFSILEQFMQSPVRGHVLCFSLLIFIAYIDYIIGYEMNFSFFYLAPIALFSWFYGSQQGILFSIFAATLWALVDWLGGHPYSNNLYHFWNGGVRLGIFVVISLLLSTLSSLLNKDYLTGLANSRAFFTLLQGEINRFRRYRKPFAVGIMDLDNFKQINDTYGHLYGNKVLQTVAEQLQNRVRNTDTLSRIGGDEFMLILPETNTKGAETVAKDLIQAIKNKAIEQDWPISISIGVVCCKTDTKDMAKLINTADELLYEVKRTHKGTYKTTIL